MLKKSLSWIFIAIFSFILSANAENSNIGRDLYIDLMKRIVSNTIYEDVSFDGSYLPNQREIGYDHPTIAHTMIGSKRLNNIQFCIEEILKENISGDFIETGVWRGGATILMRAILKAYEITDRKVWVADSFEGLPSPNIDKYPQDAGLNLYLIPYLAISLETVKSNFEKYNLLDDQVVFLKGFFSDTLPNAPIDTLALLRLDGDLYESTMDALVNLYPKLSIGGFLIVDDYSCIPACAKAVQDYRAREGISDQIIQIDPLSIYWKKTK